MRVPDGTDYVEYMLNDKPPTRQQLGSQHHACLLVPDIQAAWEAVRARTPAAARADLQKPRIGRNNKWQLNLFDKRRHARRVDGAVPDTDSCAAIAATFTARPRQAQRHEGTRRRIASFRG